MRQDALVPLRPVRLLLALPAALLMAGCGRERLEPPDPSRPASALNENVRTYPAAGLRFEAPDDWTFEPGQAPLVTSTADGSVTIAVWRYPRTEPLPREDAALDQAQEALVQAARRRDPSFELDDARQLRVDGAPAIQLVGTQRVAGRERRVRSTHVYAKQAEVVVDAYVAPRDFVNVDREVFRPLVRSLKIDPPRSG
jgi:hypothetical protein